MITAASRGFRTLVGRCRDTPGGRSPVGRVLREPAAVEAAAERAQAAALLTAQGIDQSVVDKWLADPSLPRAGAGCLLDLTSRVTTVLMCLPRNGQPIRLAQLAATVAQLRGAYDDARRLRRSSNSAARGADSRCSPFRSWHTERSGFWPPDPQVKLG